MTDPSKSVRAFAPATASNIGPGFDVLGFALEGPGDEVEVRLRPEPGVEIVDIVGDGGRLPREPERNTAGIAVRTLLAEIGSRQTGSRQTGSRQTGSRQTGSRQTGSRQTGCGRGVALTLYKRMPLSSGLGSSAASAVAAAVAAARLLEIDASRELLLRCALAGEQVASGTAHPDNAAPCLYGGFVLIRHPDPPDVVALPVPEGLTCALVRPHVEVETRAARKLLGDRVPLAAAVSQWGNLAGLVAGLHQSDFGLISRSLVDAVAEPVRAPLVPGFAAVKAAALRSGALGCSLSGSGPSIFALCVDRRAAEHTADAMLEALGREGLEGDRIVSAVGAPGARVLPREVPVTV